MASAMSSDAEAAMTPKSATRFESRTPAQAAIRHGRAKFGLLSRPW